VVDYIKNVFSTSSENVIVQELLKLLDTHLLKLSQECVVRFFGHLVLRYFVRNSILCSIIFFGCMLLDAVMVSVVEYGSNKCISLQRLSL